MLPFIIHLPCCHSHPSPPSSWLNPFTQQSPFSLNSCLHKCARWEMGLFPFTPQFLQGVVCPFCSYFFNPLTIASSSDIYWASTMWKQCGNRDEQNSPYSWGSSIYWGRQMVKHTTQCNKTRQLSFWKDSIPSKASLKKGWRKICLGYWFSSFSAFRITQRACENKFLDSSVLFWGGNLHT